MDQNNSKIKQILGWIIAIPMLLFGVYLCLFEHENLRVIVYACLSYVLYFICIGRKQYIKSDYLIHFLGLFICYIILQIILRASPFLQLHEFKLTHPTWQKASQVQIVDQEEHTHHVSKGINYAYMNVIYQYEFDHKKYSTEQADIARQYHLWLWEDNQKLLDLTKMKFNQALNQNEQEVYVNVQQPSESIYFYSQHWLDIRGSWIAHILFLLQIFSILALVGVLGIVVKKVINPNNTIQTWSKSKKTIFAIIFFIVAWTFLMGCWILLMYLTHP